MRGLMKIVAPLAVLAVAGGVVALMVATRKTAKPAPRERVTPVVRVVEARPADHQFLVRTHGQVAARVEINLVAEVPGRVVAVAPAFAGGGFFEKGEVLVALDKRDHELAVARAEASAAEAAVRLRREEAEGEVARAEWREHGTGREPDPLALREPQLAEAKATLAAARAAHAQALLDLERCEVRAPFAGRVLTKRVDEGQYANKGEILARVYSVDEAEVRLPISLEELAFVDLPLDQRGVARADGGVEARLRARVGGVERVWQARITRTEGEVDSRTRMVTAVARVADPYGAAAAAAGGVPLAVGMFVEAEILGRTTNQVLRVPRGSLRGGALMVVDASGTLRLRPVEVVRMERDFAVVPAGLEAGDRVVVSPMETPVDGMRVRVGE